MEVYFHDKKIEIEESLYEKMKDHCNFTQSEMDQFCQRGAEDISGVLDTRGEPGLSIDDILFSSTQEEIKKFIERGMELSE